VDGLSATSLLKREVVVGCFYILPHGNNRPNPVFRTDTCSMYMTGGLVGYFHAIICKNTLTVLSPFLGLFQSKKWRAVRN
jgi:hypothetical protein